MDAGAGRFRQDVAGQLARAGAEFEDARGRLRHNSGCHMGQGGAEQGRDLRRGCKIAIFAQLGGAAAVIAEVRRVQRQLHEAGKGNGAVIARDFGGNLVLQGMGRGQRVAIGYGKRHTRIVANRRRMPPVWHPPNISTIAKT